MENNYTRIKKSLAHAPTAIEPMAHKEYFAPLQEQMTAAATKIRKAVDEGRRIIIKHHNDTDGFCSGLALEKAIAPLITMVNDRPQALSEKLKRMPSPTPFYNIEDATKDIALILSLKEKFNEKTPLFILTDLGSGPENILPIKKLQVFGCEVIIVDHHPVDEVVDSLVPCHINPLKWDKNAFCAGGLCAELARLINNNVRNMDIFTAVACKGDRVDEEMARPYFDLVAKREMDENFIFGIAKVMDFESFNLRNMDGKSLFGVLLGDSPKQQRALVELLETELTRRTEAIKSQAMELLEIKEFEKTTLVRLPISDLSVRDGYPRLGTIASIIKDDLVAKQEKPLVLVGTTPNSMTFRAHDEAGFEFPALLEIVKKEVPKSFAEGGGHKLAGTFRFAQKHFDAVFEVTKNYVRSL